MRKKFQKEYFFVCNLLSMSSAFEDQAMQVPVVSSNFRSILFILQLPPPFFFWGGVGEGRKGRWVGSPTQRVQSLHRHWSFQQSLDGVRPRYVANNGTHIITLSRHLAERCGRKRVGEGGEAMWSFKSRQFQSCSIGNIAQWIFNLPACRSVSSCLTV